MWLKPRVKWMKQDQKTVLIGVVPRVELWPIIRAERWYHIPVRSAPRYLYLVQYVAFYFPGAFHEKYRCRVFYYAPVKRIEVVKRVDLFPAETKHPHAQEKYFKLRLGGI